ncbi:hypothetical protein AWB76_02511 [Caballeronia temeraria]|uniref:Uncharacterized protein n=1 Tax=Caballeronia temeraria TaxID=1777137 RepID=A0A158AL70_9BURK|nr:hypothetical protein [Caballeronia temeraria]SAK57777.1 hypothetical protein AWB76_02511 [Caballeronia temeraria]
MKQPEMPPQEDGAAVVLRSRKRLQRIADDKRVSEAVYDWLKMCNLDVHEDGSEALVGVLSAIVSRARSGLDQPTDAEVRADIEASVRFAFEHNACPRTTRILRVVDLETLPLGHGRS